MISRASLKTLVFALAGLVGCGGQTDSGVGGESHFTCAVDKDCASGEACVEGTCRKQDGLVSGGGSGNQDAETPSTPAVNGSCDGACCPQSTVCYVEGNPGPGAECLSQRNNAAELTSRIQLRQTWSRSLTPAGLTVPVVYNVLMNESQLPWADCNMPSGQSGFIPLLDFNLSGPDATAHTLRVGYSEYVSAGEIETVRRDGLCMTAGSFSEESWSLPAGSMSSAEGYPEGLPAPMPQPWTVAPSSARRLDADFDLAIDREAILASIAQDGAHNGIFFLDEAAGRYHAYFSVVYVVQYETQSVANAIPYREVEMAGRFNDPNGRSCVGAYRGDALDPSAGCESIDEQNPPWGCLDDACSPGEAPATVRSYALISEIEQVYNDALASTLCVAYPTLAFSEAEGWADPATWGSNCRGSSQWNPTDPVNGVPQGDWCARTNSPATVDCHDAYRVESFQTYAGFPIKDGTCVIP